MSACVSSPPPSLRLQPDIKVRPTYFDFSNVEVGKAYSLKVVIENKGKEILIIKGATVSDRVFSINADMCSKKSLTSDNSCTIEVRFAPDSSGSFSGTLTIISNDPDENPLVVSLSGKGTWHSVPDIYITPKSLDFNKVEKGVTSDLDVTISNKGDTNLTIQRITVSGKVFNKLSDKCVGKSITPNNSCMIVIQFTPDSIGSFSGILNVVSNDPDENPLIISLGGKGIQPRIPDIGVTPGFLNFGNVREGQTSNMDVIVRNNGEANLTVQNVTVSGSGFNKQDDMCSGKSIMPNHSCTITINFAPLLAGSFSGILSISSSDPDENSIRVSLNGRGDKHSTSTQSPLCPHENLGTFTHNGITGKLRETTGTINVNPCRSYSAIIQNNGPSTRGDFIICITPGYSLTGSGVEYVSGEGGECRFEGDPTRYKRYRRLNVEAGTSINDIKITRGNNSSNNFKFIFKLYPR